MLKHLYQAGLAVLGGACGNGIVVFFLSGIMTTQTIVFILPLIAAFNTAMSGYMLVEKSKPSLPYKHFWAVMAGVANVAVTTIFLNLLFLNVAGTYLIYWRNLILLLAVGAICAGLGGLLAEKYRRLNSSK